MPGADPREAAIEAEGLGRRFGRRWALAHLDFRVERGEAVLLAGANGSGKTTLLRLVAGLHRPTSGRLTVLGGDASADRLANRRRLALTSHASFLYRRLTALETARIWARLLERSDAERELVPALAEVGLDRHRHEEVGGFSAGMRKRLTLFLTRLQDPELVLLDEPYSSLDAAGRELVDRWIDGFRRRGRTLLLASHDVERAGAACDRALVLDRGQLVWSGAAGAAAGAVRKLGERVERA